MDERVLTSIERRILQDCKPITAKLLAIQHKIHINKARSHMETFLQQQEKNKDDVPYALYSVIGEVRVEIGMDTNSQKTEDSMDLDGVNSSMQGSQQAVYLSDSEHLDETKKLFVQSPKVCLYALSPPLPSSLTKVQRMAAISQLPNIQHELKNTVEYVNGWSESGYGAKIGGIAPAKDIIRSEQNKASSSGIVPLKQDARSDSKSAVHPNEPKLSKSESSSKLNFGSNAKSAKKEKEESEKKGAIKKSDTSKARNDDEEEEEDTPIGYVGESKMATDVPAEQGGAERKRADASDKPLNTLEEKRRRQKQELMDMMDEDKDGNADPDVPIGDSTATSMMGGEEEEKEKSPIKDKAKAGTTTKKRVQKERKVIRQERYKDERGYRATRDIEETELYTTDESSEEDEKSTRKIAPKKTSAKNTAETKKKTEAENSKKEQEPSAAAAAVSPNRNVPDSAPSAPAPKKTVNKATGGQSKLSSFFTKKK